MAKYQYIALREKSDLKIYAAEWFHSKWGVPTEAYLECMNAYLKKETEFGWYLCLDGDKIIGGMGVIENDFHNKKDLTPNVCAVYTDIFWGVLFKNGLEAKFPSRLVLFCLFTFFFGFFLGLFIP